MQLIMKTTMAGIVALMLLVLSAVPALAQSAPAGGATDQYNPETGTVTLGFELAIQGTPPADKSFFGFIPAEGGIATELTDPDGDGVYTGSMDVPQYAPGTEAGARRYGPGDTTGSDSRNIGSEVRRPAVSRGTTRLRTGTDG